VVVFAKVDNATQAMDRLQNFPIWGRPLRLAYAQVDATLGESESDAAMHLELERPATAPQNRTRHTASNFPSTVREDSESAALRRRFWDPGQPGRMYPGDADEGGAAALTVSPVAHVRAFRALSQSLSAPCFEEV
jgi:hypothetical protein